MELSAQFETGEVLKGIDIETASTEERLQYAMVLATLAVAEAVDALANALWTAEWNAKSTGKTQGE